MSMKYIASLQVKVEINPSFNLRKGVVTHEDFASESQEDLQSFFELEGVVNILRIHRKVDGIFEVLERFNISGHWHP